MDALEFFKVKNRICEDRGCTECVLEHHCYSSVPNLNAVIEEIEFVERWAKENPIKTYKDDFLEKFPEADFVSIVKVTCVDDFYDRGNKGMRNPICPGSSFSCFKCWDEEYKES